MPWMHWLTALHLPLTLRIITCASAKHTDRAISRPAYQSHLLESTTATCKISFRSQKSRIFTWNTSMKGLMFTYKRKTSWELRFIHLKSWSVFTWPKIKWSKSLFRSWITKRNPLPTSNYNRLSKKLIRLQMIMEIVRKESEMGTREKPK